MKDFTSYLESTNEVGYIQAINQSIIFVSGLPSVRPKELVITESGVRGITQIITSDFAEIMLLEAGAKVSHNMKVARTGEVFEAPVSSAFLGRILSPFGVSIDGKGTIQVDEYRPTTPEAPGISSRERVTQPLQTGVTGVDLLVPIGKGQRELIIGDQKTGKTTFALQALASQALAGSLGVYVSIGKRKSDLKTVQDYLSKMGVLEKTAIIAATSSDPVAAVYLAPFSGFTLAEYLRDKGNDVCIVLDDLSSHAKFYREVSLLNKKPPGRQSYPGDIFHIHAALLERAGNIKLQTDTEPHSITALPICESFEGDITGYIQTNLMAMTDGHIFFDMNELKKGRYPAINFALSVSRVGNQTKTAVEREISDMLRLKLASYRRSLEVYNFGLELTDQTKQAIDTGQKIEVIFDQGVDDVVPLAVQLILLGLFLSGSWDKETPLSFKVAKGKILASYKAGQTKALEKKVLESSNTKQLLEVINASQEELVRALYV